MKRTILVMNGAMLAGLAAAVACTTPSSKLCDPDQVLDPVSGECIAAPSPSADGGADAGASGEAAADAPSGDDAGDACGAGSSQLGDTCAVPGDCHCPATYCAVMPGATTGYCTPTGCDVTPSLCPSPWTCLDLSAFQAGLPHVCYK